MVKWDDIYSGRKICKGECAKCGSENIEYEDLEFNGDTMGNIFVCTDCGSRGIEWYNLDYIGTVHEIKGEEVNKK